MSEKLKGILVVGLAALGVATSFAGQEPQRAVDIKDINSAVWLGKALMVERKVDAKWLPHAQVPLRAGGRFDGKSGLAFAIWHEGSARRVEIVCGAQEWAWEGLRPGASAQLEFGCLGQKYRAQVGAVGVGDERVSLAPRLDKDAAIVDASGGNVEADGDSARLSSSAKIIDRARIPAEAVEVARLAAQSVELNGREEQAEAASKPLEKVVEEAGETLQVPVVPAAMPDKAVGDETTVSDGLLRVMDSKD